MSKKMLIDAAHPEETRVVIVDGARIEELDFESRAKRQLRGNVYLARVTRVEPSLQAAFVEYGGNRHGFLAFSEIHPDYYQIPYEDRIALLEEEEAERREDEDHEDAEAEDAAENADVDDTENEAEAEAEADVDRDSDDEDGDANSDEDELEPHSDDGEHEDEDIAEEQAKTASNRRRQARRRRYKIQEVIKRGQILLIQVVKEERGNKGAAMTTYLSLAGRYCVLMPNTPRGGGISRKISNASDRKRLKSIVSELEVPNGMGVIVRTAGAKRTKTEIKRDYDYLCRLWETTRSTTLESIAPALIHEEGNLVKRSIRDLYNKDIDEVLVQGDEAYKTAKSFIKMLMPSHAKNVKLYDDNIPLFLRYHVENQIEDSLDPVVQLKSGGYLVIHPTEALVSVDVNSGRATKERNVERTALKTNLEAADEVARQMRLRDLAGLVVIDFIDMDENRNNRAVEKRMKDALSRDRARVQAGRISQFGLMEISRQRRRRSLLEGSTVHCEHCQGVGRRRSVESSALKAIRTIEETGMSGTAARVRISVAPAVALYIFNEKRGLLQQIDAQFDMFTELVSDDSLIRPDLNIEVIESRDAPKKAAKPKKNESTEEDEKPAKTSSPRKNRKDDDETGEDQTDAPDNDNDDEDGEPKKRRRRRGRRGGRRRRENMPDEAQSSSDADGGVEDKDTPDALKVIEPAAEETSRADTAKAEVKPDQSNRRRRAPKRKPAPDTEPAKSETENSEEQPPAEEKPKPKRKPRKSAAKAAEDKPEAKNQADDEAGDKKLETSETPKPATRSTTRRKAPTRKPKAETETDAPADAAESQDDAAKPARKPAAKRTTAKKAPARKKTAAAKPAIEAEKPEAAATKASEPTIEKASTSPKAAAKKTTKKKQDADTDDDDKKSSKKGWWQRRKKD